MVLDGVMRHRGTTLESISSTLKQFLRPRRPKRKVFLLLARKLCKEGKSIDGRAFRREECTLLHKVINTCVEKFTGAKYLSLASERIVQRARELFDPFQTPMIQFTRGFPA
jgi:hypothetical protein